MERMIFSRSPEAVKKIARTVESKVIPFPYNYGLRFARFYSWLMKTQWLSPEELDEIQNERLKMIVTHAYNNVPYYRGIFEERNLKPGDIQSKDDLKLLPILTKNDVRKHFSGLMAKDFMKHKPALRHTSGSTGQPLNYYIDRDLFDLTKAIVWRHWRWCGIKHGEPIAVFRGTLINEFGKKQRSFYRTIGNETHFSTFEMSEKIMTEYVQRLNIIKPALIQGYPASLEILSRFMMENSLKIQPPPNALHTSSEVVLPEQREIIEEAFEAPLFDWYGHGESTVCAGECEYHMGLHVNMEFGCSEFIRTDETKETENVYSIISTSLWNLSMPLLRYDTEDLALLENSECKCGRGLPLITKIIGRQADIIEGINGVKASPSSLVHFWKYKVAEKLHGIDFAQIVQETDESLLVKLVGRGDIKNEELIRKQLAMLLGSMRIEFEYLEIIPRGQKWRFTVSKTKRL